MLGQEETSHISAKSVIKTVVLSKLAHVFMTLPDPNETFLYDMNKLFFFSFCGTEQEIE